jgi:hypothetical protein
MWDGGTHVEELTTIDAGVYPTLICGWWDLVLAELMGDNELIWASGRVG